MTIEFKRTKEVTNTLCKPCRLLRHFIKQHKKHPALINGAEITCLCCSRLVFVLLSLDRCNKTISCPKLTFWIKQDCFSLGRGRFVHSSPIYCSSIYFCIICLHDFSCSFVVNILFSNVLIVFLSGFCRFVSFFLHFVKTGFQKRKAEIHHKWKFLVFE